MSKPYVAITAKEGVGTEKLSVDDWVVEVKYAKPGMQGSQHFIPKARTPSPDSVVYQIDTEALKLKSA